MYLRQEIKPSTATWVARLRIDDEGNGDYVFNDAGKPSAFGRTEIAWYRDRMKFTIPGQGPVSISQTYLPKYGRDLIIEFKPDLIQGVTFTPGLLSGMLGVDEKAIRAVLREKYPRSAKEQNTPWILEVEQVNSVIRYFTK